MASCSPAVAAVTERRPRLATSSRNTTTHVLAERDELTVPPRTEQQLFSGNQGNC